MTKIVNRTERFKETYYAFFEKHLKIGEAIKSYPINFQKPWWHAFGPRKMTIVAITIWNLTQGMFEVFIPIFVGYVFYTQKYELLWLIAAYFLIFRFLSYIINFYWITIYSDLLVSFVTSAQKFFLTVDPIYHSTRASGEVISKVKRADMGFNNFLELATEDLGPIVLKLIITASSCFVLGFWAGLFGMFLLLSLMVLSSGIIWWNNLVYKPKMNTAEDESKQLEVENLAQIQLIRSVFATTDQLNKVEQSIRKFTKYSNLNWRTTNILVVQLIQIYYLIGMGILILLTVNRVQAGLVDQGIAIGFLVSLIANSSNAVWIGWKVERLIKSVVDIRDFYTFARGFGKQTFEVLGGLNELD
jgi:ABC-type multidrug transport system fused ATPase/permease subunit